MNLGRDDLQARIERHTNLGHIKQNKAFLRQVDLACKSPGITLAQAAGKKSNKCMPDLISLYRFENNDISISQLRSIRREVVLESIPIGSEVIVAHDVSQLDYTRHKSKKDRRLIGDHIGQGYEYALCLAINPTTDGIIGVLHETIINDKGPDDVGQMDYKCEAYLSEFSKEEREKICTNHRHQMAVHVNGLAPKLAGRNAIHVADREFDDVWVLSRCIQTGSNFVIRATGARNVQVPQYDWLPKSALTNKQAGHACQDGWACADLRQVVPAVPLRPYKSLPVDSRNRVTDSASSVRTVDLSIGACKIRLYRDAKRNKKYLKTPAAADVNMVVIRETNPAAGFTALRWVLFTSLPVDSEWEQNRVGHYYELRWKIETYFRLLKSGYHIEAYRQDSAEKIAKLMIVLSLAAMVIINLKNALGLPAGGRLNDQQYRRLKKAIAVIQDPNLDDPSLSLELRLFALILILGGWLGRRTDPIGPGKLMQGAMLLLTAIQTRQFATLLEEAVQNPQAVRNLLGCY